MVLQTIEATVEKDGTVHLHKKVKLPAPRRAILTILDEQMPITETALLRKAALATDWDRPEEDKHGRTCNRVSILVSFTIFSGASSVLLQLHPSKNTEGIKCISI